jgi:two-component system sensor histidine kinase PhoQ
VVLTVDDSGPGIPIDARDLVFDRFHRADQMPGGTGLGLAIADTVVRATSGTWSLSDSALGGARFAVIWRQATRVPAPPPVTPVASDPTVDPAATTH